MPTESSIQTTVDPLAFTVGPVHVKYDGDSSNNKVSGLLDTLIDQDAKTLKSVTGEIETDYGLGIYTVNAPKIQLLGFYQSVVQLS